MSDTFSKVEVITGVARRRRFSTELKLAVVAETMQSVPPPRVVTQPDIPLEAVDERRRQVSRPRR